MGLHIAAGLNHWVKSAEARILHAGRLNIGPRLILGFVFIILSMLAADAVVLWQFHVVRTQATRLHDIDQKLVAILRVHNSLMSFHDRLNALADSGDADLLMTEAGPLRTAVLEDIRRATNAFSRQPFDPQQDPTILPTLHVIQSAVPSQLEAINTLATSGDWRAVHLRLENQIRPLESLTSALVEKVTRKAGEEQAQTVLNIERVQRLVFLAVPLTTVLTLIIAATLGLVITRSITQPLARLVEGSKALARGEFQHQVRITGQDELAHLGQVFNDTARRLRDLYATLQSSEDRLRLVIDTIPAHVWSALPDGSVDYINQRWLESTGLPVEAGLGWDWGSTVHPEDLPKFVDEWHTALAAGKPMESEARLRRADGEYRWWLIRNVPLRDDLGNIINWYGTAVDIEERHRAEEALRRSEAFLHDAQRVAHVGSWRHDFSSGVLTISPEARRIWDINADDDVSVTEFFFGRMHPEDRLVVEQDYVAARIKKADFQSDFRILLPDGAVKSIHSIGHPILNQSGDIVEFVGSVIDITERKRAEEALRQTQADLAHVSRVTSMGELVASIAHEVNQPLAAIVTNGQACVRLLCRETPDLDKAREVIDRMINDGMRASEVIKRIRDLLHKAPSEKTPLNINETVQEVIELVNSDVRRSKVELLTELAADLPSVVGDRIQLQQVILNLILNAKDAMSEVQTHPRELLITSRKSKSGDVVVAVQDSGKGLDPQDAERIFDPFFTTKPEGMGLGLSISRRIIEDHHGTLWAKPNKDRGTTIQFTLPPSNGRDS